MKKPLKLVDSTKAFEHALREPSPDHYLLKLFIAGNSPRSLQAVANVRSICEESLQGRYMLEVIDIYLHPQMAKPEQIVVAPTLIRKLPLPTRKIIGDMSNKQRVLVGLNLPQGPLAG